ncbi:hypothetical protein pdam_00025659 [Pocillopora damicornis]|uniref:Uncharacterized protein n=1 Tax=Pocillopora damicornis TaxID=46731 RepID=A0A3M6UJH5_POCDA|nr:hypothetical protein pdam_00025659 [Pocillopora damicornis]
MFVMFYLNVFYWPVLKQVVGQHKMWNDMMFWFSQMIFYNAYIPLLIRQASDVEENPGPTIFDVIDPTRTTCADYSQGNEALFGENAGVVPFEIKDVFVRDNELDLREYEKRRRVNESEESREKRLAQQRLNREKKHANESSESRKRGWKPNLSIKDKKLQMNQQNLERRDC